MGYDNREEKRMTSKDAVASCVKELELNPNFKPGASGQAPSGATFKDTVKSGGGKKSS